MHELKVERERIAHELAMRQLELGILPGVTHVTAAATDKAPVFCIDVAVNLMPRFNEIDVESFLLSFEKIAELNGFPREKHAAILQAHLTGRVQKMFTEQSTADCHDYDRLKVALPIAYAVVPEVYRKRFRSATKNGAETFSDFAFHLTTILHGGWKA